MKMIVKSAAAMVAATMVMTTHAAWANLHP